ncbi:MAG: hypothetical protein OEV91_05335 [Desulfobulbaceae bacterium]|nr:hypothetical protein [Desulfobulbaceae bacterium]
MDSRFFGVSLRSLTCEAIKDAVSPGGERLVDTQRRMSAAAGFWFRAALPLAYG